ncbi:MAG TPA: alpha/beta hydrolase [Solirubrobacteraceae bacterium]
MSERFATVGEITLCYEAFGDPADPTVLLIMGLGTQMLGWPDQFCVELAGRGFHVVRYDNRDCGRSTQVEGRPPTAVQLLVRSKRAAVYSLDDMADDGVGLLDQLGVDAAHVVGASMGGMIAQVLAARRPARVRSVVSIMSSTGHRFTGQPALGLLPIFLRRAPRAREAWVDHTAEVFRLIGSPGFERDEEEFRDVLRRSWERGHDAAGTGRQLAAIIAAGDRTSQVAQVRAPTLVIHGGADRLVSPSGGRRTAETVRGAQLLVIEGMGHDLPRGTWPRNIAGIVENAARAGEPTPAVG